MRAPVLSAVAVALGMGGCEAEPDDTAPDRCRARCDDNLGQTVVIQVPSERLDQPVTIELSPCVRDGYLPDGAPVVTVLSGSFKALITPVERNDLAVESQSGFVALYPSFPLDQGDFVSAHAGDYRGSGARLAAEATLQYAAGEREDTEGCTLGDRVESRLSAQPPWLLGQSNGGNLAMAVLADEALDLPAISGVTTYETPAAAQFVTVEVGSVRAPLPLYEPGSCAWNPSDGLICDLDYSHLRWAPKPLDEEGHHGVAYFDLDGDEDYDEEIDSAVWGVRPEVDGEQWIIYSPPMTAALLASGEDPEGMLTLEESLDFWAYRDASRLVVQAVARYPELPFVVLGTQEDHTLGIEDHAHISGLAHALQQAGAAWVRVNPDRAYIEHLTGTKLDWQDNPANLPTVPGDPTMHMLPNAPSLGLHTRDYATSTLAELVERSWCGAWTDDLDHVLLP